MFDGNLMPKNGPVQIALLVEHRKSRDGPGQIGIRMYLTENNHDRLIKGISMHSVDWLSSTQRTYVFETNLLTFTGGQPRFR